MAEPITTQEQQELREILTRFYGNNAKRWKITAKTFEAFGDLLRATKACDSAMDLVPRPFRGGDPIKWASKQVRQSVLRFFKRPHAEHCLVCMKTVALSRRSQFELAQYGM